MNSKEPPGFWLGEAASLLGLRGEIKGDDFRNLLGGFSADRSTRMVHNAGSPLRRSGWDLTWSVPKSVSVAWSQAPPQIRAIIEREVRAAVRRGIAYLETIGVISRRGTDGVLHENAQLIFAAFEHSTSRAQDPQLHLHTILINVGIREDGSTGTLDPRALYRHQLAAGAIFRAELAARLERSLGLRARRVNRCFEIIGVPSTLIDEFSKRRAQIEAHLRKLGFFSAAAAEKAALDTRPEKEVISREELFPRWQQVGREFNWSAKELGWLLNGNFSQRQSPLEISQAVRASLRALTLTDSNFASRHLVQALAEEAQGRGMDAKTVLQVHAQLLKSSQIVPLRNLLGEQRWTTPEMLALEKHVLGIADTMRNAERVVFGAEQAVARVCGNYPQFSAEQRHALMHVSTTAHGVRVVSGMAGTGKSTLFRAAHEVWTAQGREVFGACLAGKAALGLSEASNIPSQTIQRTLNDLDRGLFQLDSNSVLLVDEAAMVGTRQMAALFEHCCHSKATLVLCGDARQLQAIEAGGVFRELSERFGAATLQEIKRQREAWAREAVKAFADGRTARALQEFAGRGLVSLKDESDDALKQLLADWKQESMNAPASSIILANRVADVAKINEWAQEERFRAGLLTGDSVEINGSNFFADERIVFGKNSIALRVTNGQTATITEIAGETITAQLDERNSVSFSATNYPHIQLGYALTTHKAQGLMVERAFIYVDQTAENREAVYVQASRAKALCSFYAVAENLESLVPSLSRSGPKVLATTLLPESEKAPSLALEMTL